ncbi:MAG: DHH family phosphoesterase [Erysipelotrichales bacterium]|nr:DHH family phosphoesterase [Erysipelotrichales bacterium]
MLKTIKSLKFRIITLLAIELLVITGFFTLWFYNIWKLKDIVDVTIILIATLAIILINAIAFIVVFRLVGKKRYTTDLKAAQLIGSDVQEAYNFGMIGLLVVDETDTIIWTNELFSDRQINIMDSNIFEWQPRLRQLKEMNDSEQTTKIEINSHIYEVKYLRDAMLYIFKDITQAESYYNYSQDHAPVVGYIMLDNYADVSINIDESSDQVADVRKAINDFAARHNAFLRRYRTDAYMIFLFYKDFEIMRDIDKFSILDKIRELSLHQETPLTLSMGFAHGFPDVVKLNEMAASTIDIAMSRGGDQIVVSKYGEDLSFYGGKSEAQERHNKVKARVNADTLLAFINRSSNVIIMGHKDSDLDSMGSSLGIKAICDSLKKPASVVFDQKSTESKTKSAITTLFSRDDINKIMVSPHDAMDKLKANTLVIVTDVHKPSMTLCPKLLEEANTIAVIDHHRRAGEFIENAAFSYIEPSASSASELIAELIQYSSVNPKIELPADYATFMLAGIYLDTNFFRTKTTGIGTFQASMLLKEYGADNTLADSFLKDEFEEYTLKTKIMNNSSTPHFGVVVSLADQRDIIEPATLAKVANQTLQIKGVNACFVIGRTSEKDVRISARSDGTINVQSLMEKIGGGGHFAMAAASFENMTIEEVNAKLLETLDLYINYVRTVK